MKLTKLAIAATLLAGCAFNSYADIDTKHINQVIENSMERFDVPGMAVAIVEILSAAIEDGGTSLRDHVQPGGEIGYFATQLAVYGRDGKPCKACKTTIKMIVQSGRSSFYCPRCQG